MAKKTLPQSTYATNNIQNQPDQVKGQAASLKLSFDQTGIDAKTYNNITLLPALADETLGNSGSNAIGHNSASVTANNVGDALEEIVTNVLTKDNTNTYTPTGEYNPTTKKYVDDGIAGAMVGVLPKGSVTDNYLSGDPGNIKSNVYNSQLYDAARFAVNQKEIFNFQRTPDGTTGFTFTQDTVDKVLETQSLATTTAAGFGAAVFNNLDSLDLSKLFGGDDLTNDDYIGLLSKVVDPTQITSMTLDLCSDASYTGNALVATFTSFEINKWGLLSVLKSSLTTLGTGADLTDIQSIRIGITATGVTDVNINLGQTIKKHPTLAQSEYFQENGKIIATPTVGTFIIVKEFEKYVYKYLGDSSITRLALRFSDVFENATMGCSIQNTSTAARIGIAFASEQDPDDNFVSLEVLSDTLELRVEEGGVEQSNKTVAFPIDANDTVSFRLKKDGDNLTAYASKNGGEEIPLKSNTNITTGYMTIGHTSTVLTNYSDIFITALGHTDTCNNAGTAERLEFIFKSGEITVNEIQYGQIGIDTANNKMTVKKSNTQVIDFTGVVR